MSHEINTNQRFRWIELERKEMMKAILFKGVGRQPTLSTVARPTLLRATDVVIRVHKTTICGTDLHINNGNVPTCTPGRILGHEGIGHIVEIGSAVTKYQLGDRVLTSCITACGFCPACLQQNHAFCVNGGWELGHTIDGMQAEYARIPHADYTCHKLPDSVPDNDSDKEDAYVMTSDILPTGFEIGLRGGRISDEANSIAIVGAGPVGLAALLTAGTLDSGHKKRRVFAVDLDQNRLEHASKMGATDLILNTEGDAVEQVMEKTNGKGIDFVVECIGTPAGWNLCQNMVAMGGEISILGVHGKTGTLNLDKLWQHNISIHTGLVHGHTIPYFIDQIERGNVEAGRLISHQFNFSDIENAYDQFKHPAKSGTLKVLVKNDL